MISKKKNYFEEKLYLQNLNFVKIAITNTHFLLITIIIKHYFILKKDVVAFSLFNLILLLVMY